MDTRQVAQSLVDVRQSASPAAMLSTQLLRGETVAVLDECGAYLHVRSARDSYEGYVAGEGLTTSGSMMTHRVAVPRTLLFACPDFKTPPLGDMLLGAELAIERHEGRYVRSTRGEYLIADHLMALDEPVSDVIATAETLLHTPYLWGGKSVRGIDCSGLVQLSLAMAGRNAPRDSGPQSQALGTALSPGTPLRRGDLLFWPGHVAFCYDEQRILHANAHHMKVVIEDRLEALDRISAAGYPAPVAKRL